MRPVAGLGTGRADYRSGGMGVADIGSVQELVMV